MVTELKAKHPLVTNALSDSATGNFQIKGLLWLTYQSVAISFKYSLSFPHLFLLGTQLLILLSKQVLTQFYRFKPQPFITCLPKLRPTLQIYIYPSRPPKACFSRLFCLMQASRRPFRLGTGGRKIAESSKKYFIYLGLLLIFHIACTLVYTMVTVAFFSTLSLQVLLLDWDYCKHGKDNVSWMENKNLPQCDAEK